MTISAKFCRVSCRFLPPPSQNKSQVCSATSPRVPLWTATSHTHTHTLASQCTHTQIGKSTHTQTGESTHTPPPTDWQVNTHLHSGKSTHTHTPVEMPRREWLASFLQRRLIYRSATVGCECVRFSVLASFLGKWSVVLILEHETARSPEPGAKVPRGRSRFPSEPECPRPAPPRRLRSRPFPGGRRPPPAAAS